MSFRANVMSRGIHAPNICKNRTIVQRSFDSLHSLRMTKREMRCIVCLSWWIEPSRRRGNLLRICGSLCCVPGDSHGLRPRNDMDFSAWSHSCSLDGHPTCLGRCSPVGKTRRILHFCASRCLYNGIHILYNQNMWQRFQFAGSYKFLLIRNRVSYDHD